MKAYADEEGLGTWKPSDDYYFALIGRLAATLKGGGGKSAAGSFPHMDWRFNEFPNAGAHALYVTCVEVMGVPVTSPAQVGGKFKSKTGKNSRNIVKELEQSRTNPKDQQSHTLNSQA